MAKIKKKKPRHLQQPSPEKKPRGKEKPESTETETIVWRISIIDRSGDWGWGRVKKALFWGKIHKKISNFERMTWASIKRGRHGHSIQISQLCSKARKRLEQIEQEDVDNLFSLRLSGKERIWGIREGRTLKILWWDPDHTVCPARKKHT